MAIEGHFQEAVEQHEVDGDESKLQKWKSDSDVMTTSDNSTGCFDCNICLDYAQDPVVTLCGHLFCWQCIYKWLHFQGASTGSEQQKQCPVCVSLTTLVTLYGRGHAPTERQSKGKGSEIGLDIPRRPPALITTSHPGHQSLRNRSVTARCPSAASAILPTAIQQLFCGINPFDSSFC